MTGISTPLFSVMMGSDGTGAAMFVVEQIREEEFGVLYLGCRRSLRGEYVMPSCEMIDEEEAVISPTGSKVRDQKKDISPIALTESSYALKR